MLTTILNWISGGLLGRIIDPLSQAYRDKLAADISAAKLDTDVIIKRIEDEQDARRTSKEIRLATAGFWEMRLLTFLIAFPFVAHLWSVWLDTQFKFGWRIDKFPEPFASWEGAILLSFFGVATAGAGLKAIAGGIAYRRAQ